MKKITELNDILSDVHLFTLLFKRMSKEKDRQITVQEFCKEIEFLLKTTNSHKFGCTCLIHSIDDTLLL